MTHDAVDRATPTVLRTAIVMAASIACAVLLLSPARGHGADDSGAIDAKSFRCITKMTPVRQFYVDNLKGHLDATLAAANSPTGAVYPPGSVIQLIPGEAMVKRDKGSTPQHATGSSSSSTCPRKERRSESEASPTSSTDSAATALAATSPRVPSGI